MKTLWFMGLFGLIWICHSYCPPVLIEFDHSQIIQEYSREILTTKLMRVFRIKESSENYQAVGGSGEKGAYQFMPETWKRLCRLYSCDPSDRSKENQDRVAKKELTRLLKHGYSIRQIASIWNSGSPNCNKKGINKDGIPYDVGKYVNDFVKKFNKINIQQPLPRFFYPTLNIRSI